MSYRTIFRSFISVCVLTFGMASFSQAMQPDAALKAMMRQRKKEHFFIDLLRNAYFTGFQTYSQEDEQGNSVNTFADTASAVADQVVDVAVTDLVTKALSRYTPFGTLNKKKLAVGPLIFGGKTLTKSTIKYAKMGIVNAAYFRKRYGSLWMLHFGKNYFLPLIVKTAILSAVMPPLFGITQLDRVQAWGCNSWWKNELASMILDTASLCVSSAYDYIVPKRLRAE